MNFPPDYSNPNYPYYKAGMVMPGDLFPPMPDYTHEVLVDIACQAAYRFLIESSVDEVLAKETVFAMAAYINRAFEDALVEYKIPEYFNRDVDKPNVRLATLRSIAEDIPAVAGDAAGKSLSGSPVIERGFEFYTTLMNALREALERYLLTLLTEKV